MFRVDDGDWKVLEIHDPRGRPQAGTNLVNPVQPEKGGVVLTSNWGTDQWNYTAFPKHWGVDLATESTGIPVRQAMGTTHSNGHHGDCPPESCSCLVRMQTNVCRPSAASIHSLITRVIFHGTSR